ncbi:TonB family protein [Longimicrobium terrae]|uniref:TonB family protein n=1 Tax=Longimicrobium terrae TaxID=1639882 RepID=A0A841H5C2_9BACT|nr:TonB family protein [Longimicrobium terrae]MBB4639011.1 TonB family protein [Longimicrobium terrae]MBB6073250.1 TonB family protein [Longimicrobium terrae]NNC32299.1 TonB family protein [Longimicrobium terrae]
MIRLDRAITRMHSAVRERMVERYPRLRDGREVVRMLTDDVKRLGARDSRVVPGSTLRVRLRMRLDREGVPDSIQVVTPGTPGPFRRAAIRAARRLRFRPARLHGRPVPVWIELPLTFRIPPR